LDRIYRDLLERVRAIPGVRAASLAHFNPTSRVAFGNQLRLPSGETKSVSAMMVYPGYFATMGIGIVSGRGFSETDLVDTSSPFAVVNEAFARQFGGGANPMGSQFLVRRGRGFVPCEIIGLVRDSRYASLRGETPAIMYQPFLQTNTGRGQMSLHVRIA